MDIPDTDGLVFIEAIKSNLEGSFVDCEITGVDGYDLFGKIED